MNEKKGWNNKVFDSMLNDCNIIIMLYKACNN